MPRAIIVLIPFLTESALDLYYFALSGSSDCGSASNEDNDRRTWDRGEGQLDCNILQLDSPQPWSTDNSVDNSRTKNGSQVVVL